VSLVSTSIPPWKGCDPAPLRHSFSKNPPTIIVYGTKMMRNDRPSNQQPASQTRCGDDPQHDVPMLSTIDCNARRLSQRMQRCSMTDQFASTWNHNPVCRPCIFSGLIIIPSCRRIASSPTYRYRLHHCPFPPPVLQAVHLPSTKERKNE
jgi:hypothetical protein